MPCPRSCEFWSAGRCGWNGRTRAELDVCPVGRWVRGLPVSVTAQPKPPPATNDRVMEILAVCRGGCAEWTGSICREVLRIAGTGCRSCQGAVLAWYARGHDCPRGQWTAERGT